MCSRAQSSCGDAADVEIPRRRATPRPRRGDSTGSRRCRGRDGPDLSRRRFYGHVEPGAFDCRVAKAALVWCESKQGYPRYQAPGNTCAGHGEGIASLNTEAAQLWLCPAGAAAADCETTSDDTTHVTVCDAWASDGAREKFVDEAVRLSTW